MKSSFQSQVVFTTSFPSFKEFGPDVFVIYDQILARKNPTFQKWVQRFDFAYPVRAGEELKEISEFPKHITKIVDLTKTLNPRKLKIIAIGGGSVGDFAGFVASILKRGVGLIHLPSTWLAAVDSSHGGKTALNVGRAKNQIGTFYPAETVYIVRKLLEGQPSLRMKDAFGEVAKMALIDGRQWAKDFINSKKKEADRLWTSLPGAIESKYRVVNKDPFEKTGHRQILNLGHTMGHVFEIVWQLPHGLAVAQGLNFAIQWSHHRGSLSDRDFQKISHLLNGDLKISGVAAGVRPQKLPREKIRELLLKDKKRESKQELQFIFVRGLGKVPREIVTVDQVINEAVRQGLSK